MKNQKPKAGAIAALIAVVIPVMIAIAALVIDAGLAFSMQHSLRNAADAAAKAAALELLQGASDLTGAATAVITEYGLPVSAVTVHSPPTSGAYVGQSNYVEVVVKADFDGIFGSTIGPEITVQAVAGHELLSPRNLVSVLDVDDDQYAGVILETSGSHLHVDGSLIVNSAGHGVDEEGNFVGGAPGYPAVRGRGSVQARSVRVNGGVEDPTAFSNYGGGGLNPLDAGVGIEAPDHYVYMPTPTVANGVLDINRGAPEARSNRIRLNNPNDDPVEPNYIRSDPTTGDDQLVLRPGIYEEILINSGANVVFEPGIYVLRPDSTYTHGYILAISGSATVDARGVMFYVTGRDYDPSTGLPDVNDGYVTTEDDPNWYGLVAIYAGPAVTLSPLDTLVYAYTSPVSSDFNGMLIYKRRRNNHYSLIHLAGGSVTGTLYSQRAFLRLEGTGELVSSVAVRALDLETSGTITVREHSPASARSPQVVLVD